VGAALPGFDEAERREDGHDFPRLKGRDLPHA
jgi:hypothetical protein